MPVASVPVGTPENADSSLTPRVVSTSEPLPDIASAVDFRRWLQDYVGDRPDMRSLGEGPRLAAARRQVMAELIRRAPAQALVYAVPPGLRLSAPPTIRSQLESWVEGCAVITPAGRGRWQVIIDGQTYEASFAGPAPALDQVATPLPIVGIALDGHLAVSEHPWRIIEPGDPGHDDSVYQVDIGGQRHSFADEAGFREFLNSTPIK